VFKYFVGQPHENIPKCVIEKAHSSKVKSKAHPLEESRGNTHRNEAQTHPATTSVKAAPRRAK
jgi:hypothetical protein